MTARTARARRPWMSARVCLAGELGALPSSAESSGFSEVCRDKGYPVDERVTSSGLIVGGAARRRGWTSHSSSIARADNRTPFRHRTEDSASCGGTTSTYPRVQVPKPHCSAESAAYGWCCNRIRMPVSTAAGNRPRIRPTLRSRKMSETFVRSHRLSDLTWRRPQRPVLWWHAREKPRHPLDRFVSIR